MVETLELPRPLRLARMIAWNLAESAGIPIAAFALAASLGGRNAGILAGVAALWITAVIRKLITGSVPGLLTISAIVLTVQAVIAVASGNVWIFLLHFPLANLCLCVLFARTARSSSPLCERLAAEVISLRQPAAYRQRLLRFYQDATMLWAAIFLLLAACLGVLLATLTIPAFLVSSTVATITLICAGTVASALWFRFVLRRLGLSIRFAPV
jgi:uncharacterized membrane protein